MPVSQPPINRDNSQNYGRPPFQSNSQSRVDYRQPSRCPQMDIRQNLRGPKQVLQVHIENLMGLDPSNVSDLEGGVTLKGFAITFKLHPGGMVRDNPSPTMDRRPEGPTPQNPSPQQ